MVKMGAVWDRTAEFLSDNLGTVVPVALIAFFVPSSLRDNIGGLMEHGSPGTVLLLAFASLGLAVVTMWGVLTIAALALEPGLGNRAGAVGRRRLGPALMVWIALFLPLTALLVVPVSGFLGASGYDLGAIARGETVRLSNGHELAVTLYSAAWAALYLWLSARLLLVTPLIVRDDRSFAAVGRSFRLTRGVTLPIMGVLLLFGLVGLVAILAAKFAFGSIFELVDGPPHGPISLASVLTSVMVAGVATGILMVTAAFPAKLLLALSGERGFSAT